MKRSKWMIMAALCLSLGIMAAEFTVPKTDGPITVDGRIDDSEWRQSLRMAGPGTPVDYRGGELLLSWDDQTFFVGLRTPAAPGGKLVTLSPNLCMDDSLELWIAPPEMERDNEHYKFGQFQFIVNSAGAVHAMHHNPGYGFSARKWNGTLRQASRVENDVWELEMAIPLAELGFSRFAGGDWRILPVRNFALKPYRQAPFVPVKSFTDSDRYGLFHLRSDVPSVGLGNGAAGMLPGMLRVLPTAGEELTLTLDGVSSQVRAEKYRAFEIDLAEKLKEPGNHALRLTDSKGAVLYDREFVIAPPPERLWHTPESHVVLAADFADGQLNFTGSNAAQVRSEVKNEVKPVAGRNEEDQALHFGSWGLVMLHDFKLPVPGTVSMWLCEDDAPVKTYRRYFYTESQPTGYLGIQNAPGPLLLFFHRFPGMNKNVFSVNKPVRGKWTHVAVNLFPDRVEYYRDGIQYADAVLEAPIRPELLGKFILGGGDGAFALDEFAVYDRVLEPGEIKQLAGGTKKLQGNMKWYPSGNMLTLDFTFPRGTFNVPALELSVVDGQNKVFFKAPVTLPVPSSSELVVLRDKVGLKSKLPAGKYYARLSLPASSDALDIKEFAVGDFEWLGNSLGKSDRLIPPFTALEVTGNTISCLLRDYQLGSGGLPVQIVSGGEDILAGPIRLVAQREGKTIELSGKGAPEFLRRTATVVEYRAGEKGAGLEVNLAGDMDFDGLLRLRLTVRAVERILPEQLYLDIPLRAEFAKLFHAVGLGAPRANPAGAIPAGEGAVWKSRSLNQSEISNFIPYLWFGDDERGIAFVADHDRNWRHAKERDAVELFRHADGNVSLRLHLLNAPFQLNDEHTIEFGLLATPVKPMPEGFRSWLNNYSFRADHYSFGLGSPPYWGSYFGWASRYPAFGDFEYVKKLLQTRENGVIDEQFIAAWNARLEKATPEEAPWIKKYGIDYGRNHTAAAFKRMKQFHDMKDRSRVYFYTANHEGASDLPEFPFFADEWSPLAQVSDSYADYAIWYLNKMLECGMEGVYNDNNYLFANYHWPLGYGYLNEKGEVVPAAGIWYRREYLKRQAMLMVERGLDPWITVHHTNTNILPILSFATNSMGLEWKYGASDFQTRFTPEYLRAVCQGRQGGFFPTVLDGIVNAAPAERTRVTRTMLASLLPHEIRPTWQHGMDSDLYRKIHELLYDFGIGKEDCQAYLYWDKKSPVKCDTAALAVTAYQRDNRFLLICGSFSPESVDARVTLPDVVQSARNAETGAALSVEGATILLTVPGHDLVIVEAELR